MSNFRHTGKLKWHSLRSNKNNNFNTSCLSFDTGLYKDSLLMHIYFFLCNLSKSYDLHGSTVTDKSIMQA